jgi:RNA polymerase sigma factor (sigma-70 family)
VTTNQTNRLIEYLRRAVVHDAAGTTDGQLLGKFIDAKDEAAFAALVRRHAPMVWGVCNRMLSSQHDAEDAFQASFLVLVRKGASLPDKETVGNWLYGVAHQTAVRMRALAAKRSVRERQMAIMPEPTSADQYVWNDLQPILDEELARLPDKYRTVVVLCCLEDKTRKVVARQLGIPEGTVASRLAVARTLLARRLTRRGIVVSAVLLESVLSSHAAAAGAPMALVSSTIKVATLVAAGQAVPTVLSPTVAALFSGVTTAMFVTKIKSVLSVVLVIAALAGAVGVIFQTQAAEEPTNVLAAKKDLDMNDERQVRANPPARPKPQPAKTDKERMVGNWFITTDDSLRKGEMWVITEDSILMHAKNLGVNAVQYFHRVDAGTTPKQIDIAVTKVNGPPIAVIKGIYVLDGDELRLCLGLGMDRPTAFPKAPAPGEVLILQRQAPGGEQPKAKEEQPARSDKDTEEALKALQGTWNKTGLEIDGRPNARFGNIEPYFVFKGDQFIITDYYGNIEKKGTIKLTTSEKAIDLRVSRGLPKRTTLLLRYELSGDRLRLAFKDGGSTRAKELKTFPGSGIEIYTFQRVPPLDDSDRRAIQGTWTVVSYVSAGKEASKEFLARKHQWIFADDQVTLRDCDGIGRQGVLRLYASAQPPSLSLTMKAGLAPGPRAVVPKVEVTSCIYRLKDDTLTICFAYPGRERPDRFTSNGENNNTIVILRREQKPAQKEEQPTKSDLERMAGLWTIVNGDQVHRDDGLGRKGQVWDIGTHQIVPDPFLTGKRIREYFHRLDSAKSPKQLDITVTAASTSVGTEIPIKANARIIGVIKGIYELDGGELRLCLGDMGKDRPPAFPAKPKQGEVVILQRGLEPKANDGALKAEKLRVLIDKVLAAHGGEDRLNKLQCTMTVKHSNGETQHYFVQPPKNFRWETTHPDRTGKRIVILFPQGRRWWGKEPNEEAKETFLFGAEAPVAYWHDYVKFFGPRQVLRLKDADHKVALLDEEARIGDRAAVGVEVTGPRSNRKLFPAFNRKMYFDKETHLLLKSGAVSYSDYKKFDGIPIAQKEHDGYFEPIVIDFKVVDEFDPKLFENPNLSYQPKAKEEAPAKGPTATEQKVLTRDEAIKLRSNEKVTVQFMVTAVQDDTKTPLTGVDGQPLDSQPTGNLWPAGLERSFSRAVDQIAEALPLTAFFFAHWR